MKLRLLGWLKQPQDTRDKQFEFVKNKELPLLIDLSPNMTKVEDQKQINSCTGHGVGAIVDYNLKQQGISFRSSRLFIYWNARSLSLMQDKDEGAYIRDAIKAVNKMGSCDERTWPYMESRVMIEPNKKSFQKGLENKAVKYNAVLQNINDLKQALALGKPVVFGFLITDAFEGKEVRKTGVYIPSATYKGGHCVVLVGYDEERRMFKCRNSWGEKWGDQGYFWVHYSEVLNPKKAFDFWVIDFVE